ncbi:MAG TPA: (2Fe-2S)-binding protein [Pseudomonadales bacterium]|nr:(2Fe-2S)-binding protein [Pseudomonadales bacterium]
MYICVCQAVTEKQIHTAVHNGARSMKDLRDTLGVGIECGCCAACAKQCLREAKHDMAIISDTPSNVIAISGGNYAYATR